MPFVPVEKCAQFELRYTAAGQQCANTLYFRQGSPWTALQLATACESLYNWWVDVLAPTVSTGVTLREVYGFSLETDSAPTATYAPSTPSAGTDVSPLLPNNVSLAVSFRTNRRGRAYRGRNYFLGLTESQVVESTVVETRVNAIAVAYQQLIPEDTVIPGATWVVVHRYNGRIPLGVGESEPVTSVAIVDPVVDSQRRRLPGRGN